MRTIQQQLLIWLLGGTLACSAISGSALYLKVREEANELFDAQLKQVAESIPAPAIESHNQNDDDGPEENVVVQAWNQKGNLIYASSPGTPLPRQSQLGYQTVASATRNGASMATIGSRCLYRPPSRCKFAKRWLQNSRYAVYFLF